MNETVNSDLKRLQNCLGGKKLPLNVVKTQSMILGSSSNLKKHNSDNGDSKINPHINEDNLEMIGSTVHSRLSEQVKLKFLLGSSDTQKNSGNRGRTFYLLNLL